MLHQRQRFDWENIFTYNYSKVVPLCKSTSLRLRQAHDIIFVVASNYVDFHQGKIQIHRLIFARRKELPWGSLSFFPTF